METTPATASTILLSATVFHLGSGRGRTCEYHDASDGPPVRNIEEPPRGVDELVRLADLRLLRSEVRLPQPPHALLGRLAWDARHLGRNGGPASGRLRGCVGDGGREAGCVLDAPGAHPGGHCCWKTEIEW